MQPVKSIFRKRSGHQFLSRKMCKLCWFSFMVGVTVALTVSPPFLVNAYASCESDCADDRDDDLDDCKDDFVYDIGICAQDRADDYTAAGITLLSDYAKCNNGNDTDVAQCQNDYTNTQTTLRATHTSCVNTANTALASDLLLCAIQSPPSVPSCIAQAFATAGNTVTGCNNDYTTDLANARSTRDTCILNAIAELVGCYQDADIDYDAATAIADANYTSCRANATSKVDNCVTDAANDYNSCIGGCGG